MYVVVTFLSQSEEFPTLASGHDTDYIITTFTQMMKEGRAWTIILQDKKGWLQGGLLCVKCPAMYSGEPLLLKTSWYVAPKCRGKGLSLLYAFERLAKAVGCTKVVMGHLPHVFPERLERLYLRRGYRVMETSYVKEIQNG
jgi:GNAT superfamily N-acetyltransferase